MPRPNENDWWRVMGMSITETGAFADRRTTVPDKRASVITTLSRYWVAGMAAGNCPDRHLGRSIAF